MEELLRGFEYPSSSEETNLQKWRDTVFLVKNHRRRLAGLENKNYVEERSKAALKNWQDAISRVKNRIRRIRKVPNLKKTYEQFAHREIRLEKVLSATKNFAEENLIKEGGFGEDYTGQMLKSGQLIGIRERRLKRKPGRDVEFWTEISMLSSLKHKNIISFVGFCDEDVEKIIIYEHAVHGSLDQHLSDPNLTWFRRLRICLGVARALSYIHYDVIHCDINSSKVFLDKDWKPKIFGFELSTKYPQIWRHRLLFSRHFKNTNMTPKYDVYSFGVLLFEVVYGRKPMIRDHDLKEEVGDIIDSNLRKQMDTKPLSVFTNLTYKCLNQQLVQRPTMDQIVKELEDMLELQWKHENIEHSTTADEDTSLTSLKMEWLRIPLREIKSATNNFDDAYSVGSGGYGIVYRATLDVPDIQNLSSMEGKCKELSKRSKTVAIKRIFDRQDEQGKEGFLTEIELLTSCKHPNIVSLLGFSREGREMILVYEYAFKGSLNDYFGNTRKTTINLTWRQRIQICLDIANGINYLHNNIEGKRRIIHRDIKSENILLDDNLNAKVADFGLSKFHPTNQQASTIYTKNIAGTEVYMDPEYIWLQISTKKNRILTHLEWFCLRSYLGGRLMIHFTLRKTTKGLRPLQGDDEGTLKELIDPKIIEEDDEHIVTLNRGPNQDSFEAFSRIAYQCLAETQAKRPTMEVVIKELHNALNLQGETVVLSRYRLSDILLATENFSETYCIGLHPYGEVYKAEIDDFDNRSSSASEETNDRVLPKARITVAIKRIFSQRSGKGKQGFFTEIEMRTSYEHPNIVSLLGFCEEGDELILVYEHASNNSLDDYLKNLHSMNNLTWTQRLHMCLGIAHGLDHLHTKIDNQQRVIHGDIRSANILLGKNWQPKIAYFGIFNSHLANQEASTPMSTKVYLDPKFKNVRVHNKGIDVYSFGVILLEIFCGRLAYDPIYTVEHDQGLSQIALHHFSDGTIKKMIDPNLKEVSSEDIFASNRAPNQDSLDTFLKIVYQCLGEAKAKRPTMKVIIEDLEIAFYFQQNLMKNLLVSLQDIELATENFSQKNFFGSGRFWKAYKGELPHANTTIVAKRWDNKFDDQFRMELGILFKRKHENIIGIEGYCNKVNQKITVYKHMPKGSLDKYLKDPNLKWIERLHICIDVASALEFLHGGDATLKKVVHRGIKSRNILLNDDWDAKLSNFELSSLDSSQQGMEHISDDAYLDPQYKHGFLTEKSDIYSFGVVLFEIFCGRLACVDGCEDLVPLAKRYHAQGNLDEMAFEDIKKQIVSRSLPTFVDIAYRCLHVDHHKRPEASEVAIQLKKALEYQEDSQIWEPKLPRDYKEIMLLSETPEIYHTLKKKDIYKKLYNGILLQKEKVWFVLSDSGEANKMISATMFSYGNHESHKWRSLQRSRFRTVAKMLDISNLKIQITMNTQFLSPDVVYGVYLVFKFCDPKIVPFKRMYMNLEYKNGTETSHSYFATRRDDERRDDEWMMIELHRFLNHEEDVTFKFLLGSFSKYHCRGGAIYIEGIEFRAINNAVAREDIKDLKEVQLVQKSNSDLDHLHQLPTVNAELLKRSEHDNMDEKYYSLRELNGKKHLMLSAVKVLYNSPKLKPFRFKSLAGSRFQDVAELLPQQVFQINYKIETQMLSPFTEYTCYLVFKVSEKCQGLHCPVKIRDLLYRKKKDNKIIYFRSPAAANQHGTFWVPEQREDGWMEVIVWNFNSKYNKLGKIYIPMNLKLITYEGTMSGLIICGLEFRPT